MDVHAIELMVAVTFRGPVWDHLMAPLREQRWGAYPPEQLFEGPAGCVAGETELWDPIAGRGRRIDELCREGVRPWVLTLAGPVLAEVPFAKGVAPLYRVRLASGASCLATADHLFLSPSGWVRTDSLVPGMELLSGSPEGDRRSTQTGAGSPGRCSTGRHQRDPLPLRAAAAGRASAPSQAGAHERSRAGSLAGGPSGAPGCSRACPPGGHPSTPGCSAHAAQTASTVCQCGGCTAARPSPWWKARQPSATATARRRTTPRSRHDAEGKRAPVAAECPREPHGAAPWPVYTSLAVLQQLRLTALESRAPECARDHRAQVGAMCPAGPFIQCRVRRDTVQAVTYERTDTYYDLHVPGEQHYLADGIWSHNTGKSIGIAHFLDAVARTFPRCRILVIRKTRVSLTQSWMVTFEEKVLREGDPIKAGATRAHRQEYTYPNGSTIIVGGMDNPSRTFSTEYDVIYVNEAIEFDEGEFESLYRALRNNRTPFQCMILDCNPDSEFHWLNQRCNAGRMARRVTRLWHNPAYYTAEGWTEEGRAYRKRNQGMSGVRLLRLDRGMWVTAEGTIIPVQSDVHVLRGRVVLERHKRPRLDIEGRAAVEVRFFYGTFDHGYRNPGTFQVWAVDDAKVPYLVREVYQTRKDEDWWAARILEADAEFMLHRVVCDSASPEKIAKFNRVLMEARDRDGRADCALCIPAGKAQRGGKSWLEIQAAMMRRAFEIDAATGKPRTFLFADALTGDRDPEISGKPQRFIEEAAGWTYEKYEPSKHRGMPKEVGDPDKPNHAIDAASYGFEWLWSHDLPDTAEDRWGKVPPAPGSWEEFDMANKRMREAQQRREQWS